jgi:hypothetical protein
MMVVRCRRPDRRQWPNTVTQRISSLCLPDEIDKVRPGFGTVAREAFRLSEWCALAFELRDSLRTAVENRMKKS